MSGSQSGASYPSLAEILSNSRTQSLRSANKTSTLLPSLEELQKKLEGSKETAKLNFERAFNLGSVEYESLNFEQPASQRTNDVGNARHVSFNLKHEHEDPRNARFNRRGEGRQMRRDFASKSSPQVMNHSFAHDETDIARIIQKIEESKQHLTVRSDYAKQDFEVPDFSLIELPKDFNLTNARVQLYRSGKMEIVSGDNPPRVFRCKPAVQQRHLSTDLVIATDSQVHLDRMKLCLPETVSLEQKPA